MDAARPAARQRLLRAALLLGMAALLAACATRPRLPPGRDGAGTNPPPDVAAIPDALPRVEALRTGGPNKPYEALGRWYTPLTGDVAMRESGLASWYGAKFHGQGTASGEPYDMYAMTAASKTMPIPSYARVRNPANGREVIVRVNDRGPFVDGRVIDLSWTAAAKLGLLGGVAPVTVERITNDEIRAGLWRRGTPSPPPADEGGDPLMALVKATQASAAARRPAPPATPAPAPAPAPVAVAVALPMPATAVAAAAPPAVAASGPAANAGGWWLQLGAFRLRDGADEFVGRVRHAAAGFAVAVFDEQSVYRVQAGPYASRGEARAAAETLRGLLQIVPLVVERNGAP